MRNRLTYVRAHAHTHTHSTLVPLSQGMLCDDEVLEVQLRINLTRYRLGGHTHTPGAAEAVQSAFRVPVLPFGEVYLEAPKRSIGRLSGMHFPSLIGLFVEWQCMC